MERELFEAAGAEAKERLGRDPKVGELARTPDQRRADALVELANGRVVSPEAVVPWITDADIERFLFAADGDRGRPPSRE